MATKQGPKCPSQLANRTHHSVAPGAEQARAGPVRRLPKDDGDLVGLDVHVLPLPLGILHLEVGTRWAMMRAPPT
jgi:hypothetical protein